MFHFVRCGDSLQWASFWPGTAMNHWHADGCCTDDHTLQAMTTVCLIAKQCLALREESCQGIKEGDEQIETAEKVRTRNHCSGSADWFRSRYPWLTTSQITRGLTHTAPQFSSEEFKMTCVLILMTVIGKWVHICNEWGRRWKCSKMGDHYGVCFFFSNSCV